MRDKLLSIIFLCVITLIPLAAVAGRIFADNTGSSPDDGNASFSPIAAVNDFVYDIPVREPLAHFNTAFTRRITGGDYIGSTQVLIGKDNWLYLKETLPDYRHTNLFSNEEKQLILNKLLFQKEMFNRLGIEFVVYIAPNKATVYPEYMADTVFQRSGISRADDLIRYIQSNSDLTVIYPKDELINAKLLAPTYYQTDTHWNDFGAFVGTQALLKTLFQFEDTPSAMKITVTERYREGDLARIGSVSDAIKESTLYSISQDAIDRSLYADKTVYFVGDSFSAAVSYYLPSYVKKALFTHYNEYNCYDVLMQQPDIIVYEIVERNIANYMTINLAENYYYNAAGNPRISFGSSCFVEDGTGTRYNADGEYLTDAFITQNDFLFYFDRNGYMVSNGFYTIDGNTYYFNAIGIAQRGWLLYEGSYYYFDASCHMVKDSWFQNEKEEWYYLSETGKMLTDTTTPDGYYVNEHGQWLE